MRPYHRPMHVIELVHSPPSIEDARALFEEYGRFLIATQSCGFFSYSKFEQEIAALPAPYTQHQGQVLVAYVEKLPAGCVAYRNMALDDPSTCEIKRLYVRPTHRGQGLAHALVTETLTQMRAKNYTRVILDTDLDHMPGALALYQGFGFREYGIRQQSIAFFELSLTPEKTL